MYPSGRQSVFLQYHLPAIAYAGMIVALSSIPDLAPPVSPAFPIDKLVHFLEYAGFAFLLSRSLSRLWIISKIYIQYLLTMLVVTFFASMDEIYQGLIPGRTPDMADVLADIAGAGITLAGLWLGRKIQGK